MHCNAALRNFTDRRNLQTTYVQSRRIERKNKEDVPQRNELKCILQQTTSASRASAISPCIGNFVNGRPEIERKGTIGFDSKIVFLCL